MNNFWINRSKDRFRHRGGWEIKRNYAPASLVWDSVYEEEEMPILHRDYMQKSAAHHILRVEADQWYSIFERI